MIDLSILIPCKNEEKAIFKTVNTILFKLKKEKVKNFEIIIINDYSTDSTLKTLKIICKKNKKIKYINNKKQGLGGAISTGIYNAKGTYTVIVMADLSDSPNDIIRYYKYIKKNKTDAIFGSRFLKSSKVIGYPKNKLILNRFFNNLTKILMNSNYNDFTNAFKIYRTKILKDLFPIVSENFNVFLEIPAKLISRGYTYSIIAISWRNRKIGKAKFKIKELSSKYLFTLVYVLLEKYLLKKKYITKL